MLIEINATPGGMCNSEHMMEAQMSIGDIEFLVLVVGALCLFGGVLGWASWMEAREIKSTQ